VKPLRKPPKRTGAYWVYILKCGDGTLYTGYTNNLERRLKQHASGKGGARYTRWKGAGKLVYRKQHKYFKTALNEERRIKEMKREYKLELIDEYRRKRPAGNMSLKARWTKEKAKGWYKKQPWLVGCNFIPSTAINQLEMWQKETFDPKTLRRELGWAKGLGFNTVRVYLHDLLWEEGSGDFKNRINKFLEIASGNSIRTTFVIFDACWNPDPKPGKQPAPRPGVHNSGWVQSPDNKTVSAPGSWKKLEKYVRGLISAFANDERILMWDLYNEPGNSKLEEKSFPLLESAFSWARESNPSQPLTSGVWSGNKTLTGFQLENSDIITFHNYESAGVLTKHISDLREHGRPILCTEYMARTRNSLFKTCLPVFKREKVGCYSWGLVAGKTQTIYPWGSPQGAAEPEVWFHDIFKKDGTPYNEEETEFIRNITGK
jgi:predicted GIY-YIG superfamily endonuclease